MRTLKGVEGGAEYLAFCDKNKPIREFVVRTSDNVFRSRGISSRPPEGGHGGLYARKISFSQLSRRGAALGC